METRHENFMAGAGIYPPQMGKKFLDLRKSVRGALIEAGFKKLVAEYCKYRRFQQSEALEGSYLAVDSPLFRIIHEITEQEGTSAVTNAQAIARFIIDKSKKRV